MNPGLRKFVLSVHITFSVGWIGAVVSFLAAVIAAMTSQAEQTLRTAWITMGWIGSAVLIPLSIASLVTGIIISLGTKWGLFRHYWVMFSLILTGLATLVLLGNMQSVRFYAAIAADTDNSNTDALRQALPSELLHAGVGLLVLLVIQVLNVYKPRGLTVYGWRKQQTERSLRQTTEVEA